MKNVLGKIIVAMLALALVAGSAMAQEKAKKQGKARKPAARASGVVTAVDENSITVKTKDGEATFSVNDKTQYSKMTPAKADALGETQWAAISGKISEDGASVEAKSIAVMPQPANGKGGVRGNRIMGTLTVTADGMSVQAGEQTLVVTAAEKMNVTMQEEAALTDVEMDSRVMVMGKDVDGAKQATVVRIMPAAQKRAPKKEKSEDDE